jgi:hypothetical protein
MKEIIEAKLDEYVFSILKKDTINHEDYMILTKHLDKIKAEEAQKKWDAEKEERNEAVKAMFGFLNK